MKSNFLTPIACGALLASLSLACIAQDAPSKIITRDEFRACMNEQDTLKSRRDAIEQRGSKLKQESDALKAEDDQLKEEQKRAEDSSFPGTRERFERKLKTHTARGKAAEEEGKSMRSDAETFSKDLNAHNAKCSGVSISREDREAVMKEREAAGKK